MLAHSSHPVHVKEIFCIDWGAFLPTHHVHMQTPCTSILAASRYVQGNISTHAQAITKLLRLAPLSAVLLTQDAEGHTISEEEVPSALIQRNDLLKVRSQAGYWLRGMQDSS